MINETDYIKITYLYSSKDIKRRRKGKPQTRKRYLQHERTSVQDKLRAPTNQ